MNATIMFINVYLLAISTGRNTHQRVSLPPCGDSDCVNTDFEVNIFEFHNNLTRSHGRGPFHKSSYEQVLLYEFVEPVLNYIGLTNFVPLTNLCETGPSILFRRGVVAYVLCMESET